MLITAPHHKHRRTSALLLEVVVALALMVASLAMLGAQLHSGILTMKTAEEMNRGVALVDRLLALMELDLDLQTRLFEDQEREGDFGEQYPGYFWELDLEPLEQTEVQDEEAIDEENPDGLPLLFRIDIKILYDQPTLDDPEGNVEDARTLYTVHMIRATPPAIDLSTDYGIPTDQIEQLQAVLPDFDPENFNPQTIITQLSQMVQEDPASLVALAPMIQSLLQQFAPSSGDDAGLQALQQLLGQSGAAGAAGGDLEEALGQLRELQDSLSGGGSASGGSSNGGRASGGSNTGDASPGSSNTAGDADPLQRLMELRDSLQQGESR